MMARRPSTPLLRSLKIQGRVVFALLMREILTRYGRHNIGFLWLFVEPMIFTLGITTLWTLTKSVHGSHLPIVSFALTGYSAVLLWRNMPGRCIGAIEPNLSLMFHRNVRIIDVFLSRIMLEAIGATISFLTLGTLFTYLGWMAPPEDVLQVIGGWLMLAWYGGSVALLLGSLSVTSELVDKFWHPGAYLLFPLSGAAFLVDSLPKGFQDFVLLLPMVHGVEIIREGYFGSQITAHYDARYMALCCLGLTFLGAVQLRVVARKVVPE